MNTEAKAVRVLLVEDEPMQAMKLGAILESGGFLVQAAPNGRAAFEALPQFKPDAVVSDVVMPEMDGYELCRRIRESPEWAGLKVILLTSQSEPADVIRGLQAQADNFMAKPYDAGALLQMIRSTLEVPGVGPGDTEIPVTFQNERFSIFSSRSQILNFFLSTYQDALTKNEQLERAGKELSYLNDNLTRLVDERTATLRQEVASRRKAEEESREQAELLDKAQDAILVTGLDGRVRYCNKSAEVLYGYPLEEMIGRELMSLVYDLEHPFPVDAMTSVLEKGEWVGEVRQITRTGVEIIVQSSCTLVRDPDQRPRSILTINTNLTERRKLEAHFLRTQRLDSIGALAGGIAHDLNNLIAPILLAIGVLRKRITDERSLKTLAIVESGALRAVGIVKQVLTFARGTGEERVVLQVKHLIKEMTDIAQESFPPSIDFRIDYPPDLMKVMGDPTHLHQVIMNLCVNARDAMPQGGRIILSAENVMIDDAFVAMKPEARPGPHVLVRVKDNGCGIPVEIRDRIFEPFFTTKGVGNGTGLGLSTALSIVRSHGGFLYLESEPGQGTEFQVYLPALADGHEIETLKHRQVEFTGHGETVLCVDDEEIVREMTKITLEGFGYKVIMAADGTEALAAFVAHRDEIAAVVVDLAMPHLDGTSTIRALLRLDPGVRIVGISGHEDAVIKAKASLDRNIPFLRKPFTVDRLLSGLHDVINPGPHALPN